MRRFFRATGHTLLFEVVTLTGWFIFGTRPLFYITLFLITYTCIMAPLVLRTEENVTVERRLQHAVVQMKAQDILSMTMNGISRRSPLSISIQPILPEYLIREEIVTRGGCCTVRFHVNRRGIYQVGECIVTVTDPLHLFRLSRRFPAQEQLTVFPTILPLEKLRIALTSPLDGQRVRFAPNYDVSQLAGVRPYENDPMNRIHWKMSAHRGELMVKEFSPSASKTLVVLLNLTLRRETTFTLETFEDYMTMVGASILQYTYDHRLPFGLTILGEETLSSDGYSKDATHLFACYRLLAHAKARMDTDPDSTVFLDYLRQKRLSIPVRSQLFLLQHELKEEEIGQLLRMQARFSQVSICLFPYGSFLLYGERPVFYYMKDIDQIARLKKTQSILRESHVDLSIIGINDTLAALGEA